MRISEDVLRYLTIKVDELEEGPSVMMQRGSGRDERPRRSFGDRDRGERGDRGDRGDRRPPRGEGNGNDAAPAESPAPAEPAEAAAEGDDK